MQGSFSYLCMHVNLFPDLQAYIERALSEIGGIHPSRTEVLKEIIHYARLKISEDTDPKLVFICTHNSRRSHFGSIWAHIAFSIYGHLISSHSGGTEETSFNKNAINALRRAGIRITGDHGSNPKYEVYFSQSNDPVLCWSKKYDHPSNPQGGFCALMTCSEADAECPIIPGVEKRISLLYQDPKEFDGTDMQDDKYDERCFQIAVEMLYVASNL